MYLFDPHSGKRRRALLRDKAFRGINVAKGTLDVTYRDMRNRAVGLGIEARQLFTTETVDPEVLVERVRSNMGGAVSHPGSINVFAEDGRVILTGDVLEQEADELLDRVRSVRGVKHVENRLRLHSEPGNIPGLQGEPGRRLGGGRFELMQSNWSPAARFLAGIAGGTLMLSGLKNRGLFRTAAMASGVTLLTRAVTNLELRRLLGIGRDKRGIDVQKAITINAPVDTVYKTMSDFENFPTFMKNVQRVSRLNGNRYRWTVAGPGKTPLEWESVLTSEVPNRELSWKSEEGTGVQHEGRIKFLENPDGTTTVDVRLTYSPIAGGVGHAVASLLGADPKTRLDEDLVRMKTYIETGKQPRDAAAARR